VVRKMATLRIELAVLDAIEFGTANIRGRVLNV
jgi:hypothetical protein